MLHGWHGGMGMEMARDRYKVLLREAEVDRMIDQAGLKRLSTLRETEDGFRISEVDLEMRGAGDVLGTAQSGLPRFRIADLERQAGLMAVAQTDARRLLADDPTLDTERGRAVRVLLWLMRQDEAIRLIRVG